MSEKKFSKREILERIQQLEKEVEFLKARSGLEASTSPSSSSSPSSCRECGKHLDDDQTFYGEKWNGSIAKHEFYKLCFACKQKDKKLVKIS